MSSGFLLKERLPNSLHYFETLRSQMFFLQERGDWETKRTWSHEAMRFQGSETLRLWDHGYLRSQNIKTEIANLNNYKIARLCSPISSLCLLSKALFESRSLSEFKSHMPAHMFIRGFTGFFFHVYDTFILFCKPCPQLLL